MLPAVNGSHCMMGNDSFKAIVKHFGKYAYLLSFCELEEKIDATRVF